MAVDQFGGSSMATRPRAVSPTSGGLPINNLNAEKKSTEAKRRRRSGEPLTIMHKKIPTPAIDESSNQRTLVHGDGTKG